MGRRARILFFGEGVTLAHVGRPFALAAALSPDRFDTVVACPARYHRFAPAGVALRALASQTPESFTARLAQGRRLYTEAQLEAYVTEDLRLIGQVKPDVLVGDFRLSLPASAREAGLPLATISNAYWDPDRPWRPPAPPLSESRSPPPWIARAIYRLAWPRLMRWHADPIAGVLARRGLEVGRDIRRAFTAADLTLYADFAALHPRVRESSTRRFLGPLTWEPSVPLPSWWRDLPQDRPVAYCTLGSSGETTALAHAVEALRGEGFTVIAATAGRADLPPGEGVYVADYLPGAAACARADLVLCNGGAPTTNQALAAGRPVLGVCGNMDQLLNMQAVTAYGAGLAIRSDRATPSRLAEAIGRLAASRYSEAARRLAEEAGRGRPGQVFVEALETLLASAPNLSATPD